MQKLGSGHDQLVGRLPEYVLPVENPTSVFSASNNVELAPSVMLLGVVLSDPQGLLPSGAMPRNITPIFWPTLWVA